MSFAAAAAMPAAAQAELGGVCTAADLGDATHSSRVSKWPRRSRFKGWYLTDGSLSSQTVESSFGPD